jgi:hypothetical protein
MAYKFAISSSQYLTATLTSLSEPFTLACWFNTADITNQQTLLGIQNLSNGHRSNMFASGNAAGDPVQAATTVGGSFGGSSSTSSYSANTWQHCAGVFLTTASRTVYLDGAAGTTNTTSLSPSYGTPTIGIGGRHNGTAWGLFSDANTAECGIWNVALTADEIASLAKGMTCDKVRPQSLVFYAPLVRELQDVRGGLTITNNGGATVANHPRVYA